MSLSEVGENYTFENNKTGFCDFFRLIMVEEMFQSSTSDWLFRARLISLLIIDHGDTNQVHKHSRL